MNTPPPSEDKAYIKWKTWSSNSFGTFSRKDNATFSMELAKAGVLLNSESRVLEIGFGNGSFAAWVIRTTQHYVGLEKNEILVERALRNGIEAHLATIDVTNLAKDQPFDLIVMFDVLEHMDLHDAILLLQSIAACLSPSGTIVVRIPSGDSPFSGHIMYGDITHKLMLGRFAIFQIAESANLHVISVHDSAFPITGMGLPTAIRRTLIFMTRLIIGKLLKLAYYANEPVVLSPTLTAVLSHGSHRPNADSRTESNFTSPLHRGTNG